MGKKVRLEGNVFKSVFAIFLLATIIELDTHFFGKILVSNILKVSEEGSENVYGLSMDFCIWVRGFKS